MLTGLFIGAVLLVLTGFGVLAIPFLIIGAILWLVLLPVRLLFHLAFGLIGGLFQVVLGIGGALLGIVLLPLILGVVGIALVIAFVAALLALVAPLVPVVLLGLLGWGVYRLLVRPTPTT